MKCFDEDNKGMKDVIIKQVDGRTSCYTLELVKYCNQAQVNLVLLTSALSKGVVHSGVIIKAIFLSIKMV